VGRANRLSLATHPRTSRRPILKPTPRLILLCSLSLCASAALADSVEVSVKQRALLGKGLPSVQIHIVEPIAGFELKLRRSDGKDLNFRGGGKPGTTRSIDLDQPEGKFSYTGELTVNLPKGGTGSMPLQFDAELWGPLRLTQDTVREDVEKGKVYFKLSRPIAKAHLMVLTENGEKALDDDINFNEEPAGTRLSLDLPKTGSHILKIDVKAYDALGFFTGFELYPWQIDIPHEDVNFDSGKWDVRSDEAPKLDKAYQAISDALAKYGRWADVKLYLIGHTDTVGSSESNRTLSLNRARSIGGYFRKKGVRVGVFYEGYGEQALLVGTADEKDEPRNRRAQYILSVEPPSLGNAPFQANWRKL
jgi:outer membrane protein OmpA-like peptidoglycan-associated protein